MIKMKIDGIECVFYENNLSNDNLVLIKYGSSKITTKEIKNNIDYVISIIHNLTEIGAIFDESLEKYTRALSFFNVIKALFNKKRTTHPSVEDAKIAIDVVKEISLMELKDPMQRAAIKSVSLFTKLLLDMEEANKRVD